MKISIALKYQLESSMPQRSQYVTREQYGASCFQLCQQYFHTSFLSFYNTEDAMEAHSLQVLFLPLFFKAKTTSGI